MIFHLSAILSVATGILVSPYDGVHKLLNFMTGKDLFSLQLPRAAEECKPRLIEQMPWLSKIDAGGVDEDNYLQWLDKQVEKYGEYHEVRAIHPVVKKLTDSKNK